MYEFGSAISVADKSEYEAFGKVVADLPETLLAFPQRRFDPSLLAHVLDKQDDAANAAGFVRPGRQRPAKPVFLPARVFPVVVVIG